MPSRSDAAEAKVRARLQALAAQNGSGALNDVMRACRTLAADSLLPVSGVRVRRTYLRHTVPRTVERERNGLPREERPPATRLITPRGIAGRVHLTLLFVARCQSRPNRTWNNAIPLEPDSSQPLSWMSLVSTYARHTPGGRRVASPRVNKARQITEALKSLAEHHLLEFPHAGSSRPFRDFQLLCDSGASTAAAPIPYKVPKPDTPGITIPVGFFTRGWVSLLTPSETAAYLMWLDVAQNPMHPQSYVTGAERAGHYGLGRDAYETHRQLEAFGLIDVEAAPERHPDGKYADYGQNGTPICHRVTVTPDGLRRNAADTITPVLRAYAAEGRWTRPLGARATARP